MRSEHEFRSLLVECRSSRIATTRRLAHADVRQQLFRYGTALLLGLAACTRGSTARHATVPRADFLQYRWVDTSARDEGRRYIEPGTGQAYELSDSIALTLRDVARADVNSRAQGGAAPSDVIVRLTPAGTQKWAATTSAHVGQRIAVLLDGRIVQTAVVESALGAVAGVVTNVSPETARYIASRINGAVIGARPP